MECLYCAYHFCGDSHCSNVSSVVLIARAACARTKQKMFENFLTNLKNQTNNLTDNLITKTRRLAFNINSFKEKIVTKPKTTYYTISRKEKEECDYFNNDYLSPRAHDKWPSITENMQWVPYVPPKLDEQNIVDRFIKVITIDDEGSSNVSSKRQHSFVIVSYDCVVDSFVCLLLQRRTDREEIRRRLAMGSEDDYYGGYDRPGRKPSLQSRLQSGMYDHC